MDFNPCVFSDLDTHVRPLFFTLFNALDGRPMSPNKVTEIIFSFHSAYFSHWNGL